MVESKVDRRLSIERLDPICSFSHNAGVNYANRNATQHTPVSKFAIGYLSAVTVSVSIAVRMMSCSTIELSISS